MGLFESIAGGLVTGGLSILGGQLDAGQERQQQRHQDDMTRIAWSRDDSAVQRRVADAKAAGLHPLYALGANVGTSAIPQYIGQSGGGEGIREAGQSIGSAVARMKDPSEKLKDQLETRLIQSQIGETDARRDYYNSLAARESQAGLAGIGVQQEKRPGIAGVEGQSPNPPGAGVFEVVPPQVPAQKLDHPGVKAGIGQGNEERMLAPGFPIVIPDTGQESPEEIFSEMSLPAFTGMLLRNTEYYGEGWLQDFLKFRYLGQMPSNQYSPLLQQGPRRPKSVPREKSEDQKYQEFLQRKRG